MPMISRTAAMTISSLLLAHIGGSAQPAYSGTAQALHVTSRDGTRIAYDTWGKGPAVILVNGALAERSGNCGARSTAGDPLDGVQL